LDRTGEGRPNVKRLPWEFRFGLALIAVSAFLYVIHFVAFRDAHHIFLWSLTNLAFLPVSVLLVTLVVNRLLINRERQTRLDKLDMLIGSFFSGVGTKLITHFSSWDPNIGDIRKELAVTSDWSNGRFLAVGKLLRRYSYDVDVERIDFEFLSEYMWEKSDLMLRLLENPNLMEHTSFTNLLRAVFHLAEELASRERLSELPDSDYAHLAGDVKRAYRLLVYRWLDHMRYLKSNYPYLFSLAMRTNPLREDASPIVT
jgi:hypothetical protein